MSVSTPRPCESRLPVASTKDAIPPFQLARSWWAPEGGMWGQGGTTGASSVLGRKEPHLCWAESWVWCLGLEGPGTEGWTREGAAPALSAAHQQPGGDGDGAAGRRALICCRSGDCAGPEHTWAARKTASRSAQSLDGHPLNQPHRGWGASTGPKFKHVKGLFHVLSKSLLTCMRKSNMKLRVSPAGQYKSQSPKCWPSPRPRLQGGRTSVTGGPPFPGPDPERQAGLLLRPHQC